MGRNGTRSRRDNAQSTYDNILAVVDATPIPTGNSVHVAGEGAIAGYLATYIDRDATRLNPLPSLDLPNLDDGRRSLSGLARDASQGVARKRSVFTTRLVLPDEKHFSFASMVKSNALFSFEPVGRDVAGRAGCCA